MNGETRSNQGYAIIESCTIGNTELVIGHHPKAPNPYVCWYCKGGDNYYWGCYCNTLEAAKDSRTIFCDVCIRKILDEQREKKQGKEKPDGE